MLSISSKQFKISFDFKFKKNYSILKVQLTAAVNIKVILIKYIRLINLSSDSKEESKHKTKQNRSKIHYLIVVVKVKSMLR